MVEVRAPRLCGLPVLDRALRDSDVDFVTSLRGWISDSKKMTSTSSPSTVRATAFVVSSTATWRISGRPGADGSPWSRSGPRRSRGVNPHRDPVEALRGTLERLRRGDGYVSGHHDRGRNPSHPLRRPRRRRKVHAGRRSAVARALRTLTSRSTALLDHRLDRDDEPEPSGGVAAARRPWRRAWRGFGTRAASRGSSSARSRRARRRAPPTTGVPGPDQQLPGPGVASPRSCQRADRRRPRRRGATAREHRARPRPAGRRAPEALDHRGEDLRVDSSRRPA